MTAKPGKHTPFFELVDAQHKAGCPICRLIYRATSHYIDGLLYEAVLDPAVRTKLKRSRGFCAAHVEVLRSKAGRSLGIALIYRDVIRTLLEATESSRFQSVNRRTWPFGRPAEKAALVSKLEAHEPCPVCAIAEQTKKMYIEILLAHLDDERLSKAYVEGEGLCLEHFLLAIQDAPDEPTFERLVRPQADRYARMLADLDEFIRKRDHRFRLEEHGEEGDVWLRVLNTIVGGAGMGLSAKWGSRRAADLESGGR